MGRDVLILGIHVKYILVLQLHVVIILDLMDIVRDLVVVLIVWLRNVVMHQLNMQIILNVINIK